MRPHRRQRTGAWQIRLCPSGTAILVAAAMATAACRARSDESESVPAALQASVDLTIGTLEGPDEYTFGRVTGLAADAQGRIYVADGQAHTVRVYDSTGVFLALLATRGGGPGEVQRPCCLSVGPQGRLWIRDNGNRRYNWHELGGDAGNAGSIRMAHSDGGYAIAPTFGPDGHLVDVGHRTDRDGVTIIVRFHRDSSGGVQWEEAVTPPPADSLPIHEVTRRVEGGISRYYLYQPFGAHHLVAHSPNGGWAEAVSSVYAVRLISPQIESDMLVTRRWDAPAVTPAERDSASAILTEQAQWAGVSVAALPFDVPTHKAPLRTLQFDQLDRLWSSGENDLGRPL